MISSGPAAARGDEARLRQLVGACPWLVRVLTVVRGSELPDAWVGAGTLRDLVWSELYGSGFDPAGVRDIDVPFFDPTDFGRDRDRVATALLADRWPGPPWEAKNQAAVHTWYADRFGGPPVEPLRSIADAVATWPETATAVAVRLDNTGRIEVCAPLGLADLLGGVWRRNPARASPSVSRERLARHQPARRWPGVRVLAPPN